MPSHHLHELAIVVCTRDRPGMLADALVALLATVDESVDVIVVDSASRDGRTRDVVAQTRARYLRSDVPGLSIARNVGLHATDRAFVAYTDDDCVPMEGWAQHLLDGFTDHRIGAVSGRMLDHTLAHTLDTQLPTRSFSTPASGLDAGHGAVMAFRREALLDVGGFDEVLGAGRRLAGAEELDAFVRLIRAGYPVVNNPASVVLHANTREDVDYAKLHRGYGRGLGAMAGKWLRIDPPLGATLLARSLVRSARRAMRADRGDVRRRVSSLALIEGTVAGLLHSVRLRLAGTTFVDANPPRPVGAAGNGGATASGAAAVGEAAAASSDAHGSVATSPDRRPVRARPIRILDEKYVANTLAFVAARPAVTVVVEKGAFRRESGELDREAIALHVAAWAERTPALRQRLVTAPLGLFTPSWVPVDYPDMAYHLRFSDTMASRDFLDTDLVSGFHNGPLDIRRPLWSMLVVPLDSGEIAFVGQIQHVVGDGIYALRIISNLINQQPLNEYPALPRPDRAPSGPVELVRAAVSSLRADYPSLAEALADYRRKPLLRRARRMIGRNLRPARNRAIERRGLVSTLPARHTRILETDLTASKSLARDFKATLNDLTVAVTLIGLSAVHPDSPTVATFVPVAPRATGGREVRNNIRMVRVEVPNSLSLTEVLPQVHSQIADAVDAPHDGIAASDGSPTPSYASFLPTFPRTHYLGPAEAVSVALWPTLQPDDELAVFGSSYKRTLSLAITVHTDVNLDTFASAISAALATPRGANS